MSKKTTRKALLGSVLALVLCVAMLVGSTFAWFTDSVTSGRNTIQSGNLDAVLEYSKDGNTWTAVDANTPIFKDEALYEPGYTDVAFLRVSNNGSLAFKYQLALSIVEETPGINVYGDEFKLSDHLEVVTYHQDEYSSGANYWELLRPVMFSTREATLANAKFVYDLETNTILGTDLPVLAGEQTSQIWVIALNMPTTVGNEANHNGTAPSIMFGVDLVATQLTHESDSFGSDYDIEASYPAGGVGFLRIGDSAVEVDIINDSDNKIGSAVVPAGALSDPSKAVEVVITPSDYEGNITVATDSETVVYDVKVLNLKENNTVPVKIELNLKPGLDPATVKLYHYDTEIACTYNPNDGNVTFESATFSPFTLVYDAESVYTPPVALPEDLPVATVVNSTEYENVNLPWGSYGAWSPTEGLDSQLEAAYTFSCAETLDEAKANPYANWYCDFYVMLDKDLGANEIFLGGNYGSFGWVGFHNGDLALDANTEIPLLGSVTSNPWTYVDVVQNVGEFICGVGDVDDALAGATFTVMLRLTNPDDEAEFYNVKTINYTFE